MSGAKNTREHCSAHACGAVQSHPSAQPPRGTGAQAAGGYALLLSLSRPAQAVRLLAWADAMREMISDSRPPVEQADVDRDLAVLQAQLDEATFKAEQEIGRKMTRDEAIEYALSTEGEP